MAMAGITEAQVNACNMRCGTGGLKPVREVVRNNFRGRVVRFCGLLPASILRACFERAIETADGMLLGFSNRALHCSTNRVFCEGESNNYIDDARQRNGPGNQIWEPNMRANVDNASDSECESTRALWDRPFLQCSLLSPLPPATARVNTRHCPRSRAPLPLRYRPREL